MPRTVALRTCGTEATRALAAAVAAALEPGDVVSLTGELGAGKTCFVQGAAAALGVRERVTSPTFLLRRDYQGRVPVTHLDVYRLERLQDVLDLGYGEDGAVVFVEWGDAMRPLLPAEHLEVELLLPDPGDGPCPAPGVADADAEGEEARRIRLHPHGAGWQRRLAALEPALAGWREE